jgi:membrane protein DedA with SNARE-associated domain
LAVETPRDPPVTQPVDASSNLQRYVGWIWPAVALALVALWIAGLNPLDTALGWYGDLTRLTLQFAEWLLDEYGYAAVFIVPLLENSFFLGLIVPGAFIIVIAGIGAQQGLIDWYIALPLAILGAIIGDTLSYLGGRYAWVHVFGARRVEGWRAKWRDTFLENARWVILLYHFLGYTRLIGPTAAGVLHIPFRRWAPLDYAGVALWVVSFGAAGYVLGVAGLSLEDSEDNVRVFEWAVAALVVIWVLVRVYQSRPKQVIEAGEEA